MSVVLPAHAVVEGLHDLARGWHPSADEGPGALVPQQVWRAEVRRLADDLLGTRADVCRAALRPSYWGRLAVRYRAAL